MITILRRLTFTVVLSGVCANAAVAQTVVSRSKTTGGTVLNAAFNDSTASAQMFQTTLADGTPALYVNWGGPTGFVAGVAPLSAGVVRGGQVTVNLDAASLLEVYYSYGTPSPCRGAFSPVPNDHLSYFYSTSSTGNQTQLYFQPYGGGGGIQYETKVAGTTSDSSARFSGTCAGATVVASSPSQSGYLRSHAGNISQVVTTFP